MPGFAGAAAALYPVAPHFAHELAPGTAAAHKPDSVIGIEAGLDRRAPEPGLDQLLLEFLLLTADTIHAA
jgi:hypothetical protein